MMIAKIRSVVASIDTVIFAPLNSRKHCCVPPPLSMTQMIIKMQPMMTLLNPTQAISKLPVIVFRRDHLIYFTWIRILLNQVRTAKITTASTSYDNSCLLHTSLNFYKTELFSKSFKLLLIRATCIS